MPFWNLTPWTTFGNWFSPFNRRQVFAAAVTSLNTMSLAVLVDRAPFVLTVRCRTVANTLSIGFDVRRWSQCSAGKSKNASSASLGEYVDRSLGRRTGRRAVNLAEVGPHVDLNRESNLVQDVGGLVDPTALVPAALEDLIDRLPEAERAVANREVRCNLEPTLLDVDKELTPALRTLAHPGLEADEFLLALGCCTDQHQHAFGSLFHPSLQVD